MKKTLCTLLFGCLIFSLWAQTPTKTPDEKSDTALAALIINKYLSYVDFTPTLPWVKQIIEAVLKHGLPADVCLNVNMPAGEIHGIKVTTAGMGCWRDEYDHRVDPFGRDYYWMTGRYEMDHPDDPTTDLYNLERGWIAATPCRVDQTAHDQLAAIGDLLLNK